MERTQHIQIRIDAPLLTAAEVGELLGGIPAKSILAYARDGRLPCRRIGKHVRFARVEIEAAISSSREL